jgi:hypothetical protein
MLFLISIYILICGTKNYTKCVQGVYVLLISIPLSSYNYIDTITITQIGAINVMEIALIELFVISIIINRKEIRADATTVLVIMLFFFYLIRILLDLNMPRCIADAKDYILPLILFYCFKLMDDGNDENSWKIFLDNTLKGVRINSIIILIGYLMIWLPGNYIGRYSFSCESLYVFTIPQEIFNLSTYRKKSARIVAVVFIIIEFFLVLVSQTRTNIICITLLILLLLLLRLKDNSTKIKMLKRFFYIIFFVTLIAFFCFYFLKISEGNGNGIRMVEIIKRGFKTDSNIERGALINYYIPQILKTPLGHGFGALMHVWTYFNGMLTISHQNILAVDNFIITYLYKLGIIPFLIYFMIFYIAFTLLIKNRKVNIFTSIAIFSLILPTAFMSVQMGKNLAISCFWWSFIYGTSSMTFTRKRLQYD